MKVQDLDLSLTERVTYQLRSLYSRHGYTRFKMNKFEEYDLYANNKDFLLSDSVLTFTDGNGKLMALKPDVTLSIVKSSRDDAKALQKLYYNENVYRAAKGGTYRELMQVGLECIGKVDEKCVAEVVQLAAESLKCIGGDGVLAISHLGLLSDVIAALEIPGNRQDVLLKYIGERNIHELAAQCRDCGVAEEKISALCRLIGCSGSGEEVLREAGSLLEGTSVEDLT